MADTLWPESVSIPPLRVRGEFIDHLPLMTLACFATASAVLPHEMVLRGNSNDRVSSSNICISLGLCEKQKALSKSSLSSIPSYSPRTHWLRVQFCGATTPALAHRGGCGSTDRPIRFYRTCRSAQSGCWPFKMASSMAGSLKGVWQMKSCMK